METKNVIGRKCKFRVMRCEIQKRTPLFDICEVYNIFSSGKVLIHHFEEVEKDDRDEQCLCYRVSDPYDILELDGEVVNVWKERFLVEIAEGMVFEVYPQNIRLL